MSEKDEIIEEILDLFYWKCNELERNGFALSNIQFYELHQVFEI